MDHHAGINKLKNLMTEAKEFHTVWEAFFNLVELPRFIEQSDMAVEPKLCHALPEICRSVLGNAAAVLHALHLLKYRDSHFFHGFLAIAGNAGNVMYFDDIDSGMILLSSVPDGEERFARFTLAVGSSPHGFLVAGTGAEKPFVH